MASGPSGPRSGAISFDLLDMEESHAAAAVKRSGP